MIKVMFTYRKTIVTVTFILLTFSSANAEDLSSIDSHDKASKSSSPSTYENRPPHSTPLPGGEREILTVKERIATIGERISKGIGLEAKILVIDEHKPEAYVYPDKTIIITTALAELAGSDDEIAFVIGHEMGHITKEHCNEEEILSILNDPSLPDWKRHEIEADISGITYARKEGYDPSSAEKLLSKMLYYTDVSTEAFTERIDAISIYLTDLSSKD